MRKPTFFQDFSKLHWMILCGALIALSAMVAFYWSKLITQTVRSYDYNHAVYLGNQAHLLMKKQPVIHPPAIVKSSPAKTLPAPPSAFALEQKMNSKALMNRWNPYIREAAKRFSVPQPWIRAVVQIESGGRTMRAENTPIISSAGAMGLMQLMPQTYRDMRVQYSLGADPYDPHDNIIAGTAYLRFLRSKYPYPTLFAAYNDGPGNLETRLVNGGLLPDETEAYLSNITNRLENGGAGSGGDTIRFTRPNGAAVTINAAAVVSVRAAFPGEYAPGVQTVITIGHLHQGVMENLAKTKSAIQAHGGGV